jgi:uncharacterized protein
MRNNYILNGILLGILFLLAQTGHSQELISGAYPFQPVPFNHVKIDDQFWAPRIETNRIVTIPYDFKKCEETGRINNFAVAAGVKQGKFIGMPYDDSDVYKVIEGASYSLQQYYDPKLDAYLDSIIGLIAGAQEEDGYLYTNRSIDPQTINNPLAGEQRWSNLKVSHELYDLGHLYEAAVANYMATGKKNLLNVALKSANFICNLFGPGKLRLVPGHQEIEIGLVKLYRVTGEKKYLDMAKFFIDERGNARGHKLYFWDGSINMFQDDMPIVKQTKAVGHCVRAGYFYSAIADVAALTNDTTYIRTIDRMWNDVAGTKTYLTGGIGSRRHGEAFGESYELPNDTAYNETCAAVANSLWNFRMFLLHGESKYIDLLERILYNGFLSGVSLEGNTFFYPNVLECNGNCQRSPWFGCSCCPVNIARIMPSIPGYIYATQGTDVYVNLFIGNSTSIKTGENEIQLKQVTNYPWDGQVKLTVNPAKEQKFSFYIRIPGWAVNRPMPTDLYTFSDNKTIKPVILKVNGKKVAYQTRNGYAVIERTWKNNDEISIDLPMEVRRIAANPKVEADRGKEAWQRGPIVYCFEGIDNNGNALKATVTDKSHIGYSFKPDLLKGIGILQFKGQQVWKANNSNAETVKNVTLTAIPY